MEEEVRVVASLPRVYASEFAQILRAREATIDYCMYTAVVD